MFKNLILLSIVVSSQAFGVSIIKEGISPISQGPCTVEYDYENNQISNFLYRGAVEIWEIIAETDDGYGPDYHVSSDNYLFGDLEDYSLEVSKKFLSPEFSVKAKRGAEGIPFHMAVNGTIKGTPDNPSSLELKMSAKLAVVTVGYKAFSCEFDSAN